MTVSKYDEIIRDFRWDIPESYNLGYAISDRQVELGHDVAIRIVDRDFAERHISFEELSHYSNRLANRLIADGFGIGDRVAVMLPASFEAAVAHIAILKAGMISVPLLPDQAPGSSADKLDLAGASGIFTSVELAKMNGQAWRGVSSLQHIYPITGGHPNASGTAMETLIREVSADFRSIFREPSAPALLGFTSGSEGAPKGVLHAQSITMGGLPAVLFSELPTAGHIIWSHFEWGWLGGLLVAFGAWSCGASVLLHEQTVLSPGKMIELLRTFGVHHASIAPTALKMLKQGTRSAVFPKLLSITSGGEKLDLETRSWVEGKFGIPLSEIYGLSECGAVLGSGYILPIREGAIGKPAPGQSVHIISEDGTVLPPGQAGLIAVQAPHPSLFLGYWNDEAATKARFIGNFFNTGDMAYRDEDGYFWYVGRADDIISNAGHRVGPGEIEEAFLASPAVNLCVAFGVPDTISGESIALWVELAESWLPDQDTLNFLFTEARKRLAPYQMPKRIRFVQHIPRTGTGKVHRRAAREEELKDPTQAG
jgi:acetyl-CoA synthetase